MNLLAKSLGQLALLAVALFFFSCEDETTLGYRNPNKKFQVNYVEIPLQSSVVLLDSNRTDRTGVGLIGKYSDPLAGNISAQPFLQFFPNFSKRLTDSPVFDSVTLEFRVNFYTYGFSSNNSQKFTVHELADSVDRFKLYYNDNTIGYDPNPVGQFNVGVNYETYKKQYELASNQRDTVVVSTRLTDAFGQKLFDISTNSDFTKAEELAAFFFNLKGLTLVSEESNGLIGLDIASGFSRLNLHYHTSKDTTVAVFLINSPSFSNVIADRSGTELGGYPSYQGIESSNGLGYVQSGSLAVTKLDLANFYAFADTVENIIINRAELSIEGVQSEASFSPHSQLILRAMNENNLLANMRVQSDREQYPRYYVAYVPVGSSQQQPAMPFAVWSDNFASIDDYATLAHDQTNQKYNGFITTFAQSLFRNKHTEEENTTRLQYLAVYPYSPVWNRSVNRTVFNKDQIKLRIYYTRPTQLN